MGDVLDRSGATARRRARAGRHALTSRLGWATLWARLAALGAGVALLAVALSSLSSAQVVGSGDMQVARQGHTATLLADGRIVLIGGENASGPVGEAEVYDPISGTFSPAGSLVVPRADHSATLRADGRVLVAGGRANALLLNSTEVFDPATGSFAATGALMQRARAGHTATVLADGSLLIVGGDPDGSAERRDPATGSFTSLPAFLNVPRMLHAAALLQSGKVLIVGGVGPDGSALDSAEMFDPATLSFDFIASAMTVARVLPYLRVLPDGKVQVIGGNRDTSMEVFDPTAENFAGHAELLSSSSTTPVETILRAQTRAALFHNLQDASLVGVFASLLDREGHSLTEMPARNQALVAGGVDTNDQPLKSAAVLASSGASVTTDKTDYSAGEFVTITGAGWQPGEAVSLVLHESPTTHADIALSTLANGNGSFANAEYSLEPHDAGKKYTLT